MPTNILEDVSHELADVVDSATDDEKRALRVPASQLAISRTNLDEPLISEAVLSAFSDDAFKAATYCLYETYCAGASVEEIEAIVTDTLNQVRARS